MPVTPTPVFPQIPNTYVVQLTTGSSTATYTTLATGGTNGTKITSVIASNSDSTANNARLAITNGGVNYVISLTSLAIGAGFLSSVGNPSVSLMPSGCPVDNDGQQYLFLASSLYTLTVNLTAVPGAAGSVVTFTAFGADF